METQLISTIRDENKKPRGTAIIIRQDDKIFYGYALCNTNADRFCKKKGVKIATARAFATDGYRLPGVPEREQMVLDAYKRLEHRAIRYFKDLDPSLITIEGVADIIDED